MPICRNYVIIRHFIVEEALAAIVGAKAPPTWLASPQVEQQKYAKRTRSQLSATAQ